MSLKILWALSLTALTIDAACPPELGEDVITGHFNSSELSEISGASLSWVNPNVIWCHNDGNGDSLLAITTRGELLVEYEFGRTVEDMEDMATGPGPVAGRSYLYLGDIGNNSQTRNEVRVFRVAEPAADPAWASAPKNESLRGVERFELTYPDGLGHNAEGLMVDPLTGDLFIVSKEQGRARVYRAAAAQLIDTTESEMTLVADLPFEMVSSATISRDGRLILIRREEMAILFHRNSNESVAQALQKTYDFLPLVSAPDEPNGESIEFDVGNTGIFSLSEGRDAPVRRYPLSFPIQPLRFSDFGKTTRASLSVEITGCPGSRVRVQSSTDLRSWKTAVDLVINEFGTVVTTLNGGNAVFYRLISLD